MTKKRVCEKCGHATVHQGHLCRLSPAGPDLDPFPELCVCIVCRHVQREDGVPFDSKAHNAQWDILPTRGRLKNEAG